MKYELPLPYCDSDAVTRPLVIHYEKCAACPGYIDAEWAMCDCTAEKDLETLLTAARDEVATGNARGALVQAVKAFDKEK